WFILPQVPAGLAGLVISGVLAAAMSSLDSSINSIATVTTVDLLKPWLAPGRNDRFYLRFARLIAVLASAVMIGGAVFFSSVEKESMNDLSWIIASVFGGCLLGLFMLGFFTRRVDNTAAVIGLLGAILVNLYLGLSTGGWLPQQWSLNMHSYWVGLFVNLAFISLALLISLFRRPNPRDLTGLTIWTQEQQP
ncbi:MAG TPA: sodium:solute symporter, partial [Gimesia maris]|nr:sodium:solute symporter [Gimesia maris]